MYILRNIENMIYYTDITFLLNFNSQLTVMKAKGYLSDDIWFCITVSILH